MKTTLLPANQGLASNSFVPSVKSMAVVLLLFFVFTACSDDDEPISPYVGTYTVVETDESNDTESYTVKIAKTSTGFEFTNFGDIMHVPVKANVNGKILTIPAQTFVGKSMTIIVSGEGKFSDTGVLTFDYSIDSGDEYVLDYSCVATRQP